MFKHLIFLCLACLLLCGCAGPSQSDETAPTLPVQATVTQPESFYHMGSTLEQRTQGAVRAYPLNASDFTGLEILGESVLLFSGEKNTTLTLISPDGSPSASADLGIWLDHDDASLQIRADTLSYYDRKKNETVILDKALQTVSRISVPDDLMGIPMLSGDLKWLYYCTPTALRAMEVETGICRCIREMDHMNQTVSALLMDGTVLACVLSDENGSSMAYISAKNGRLLGEGPALALSTVGSRYYVSFPTGSVQTLLYGVGDAAPQALTPADLSAQCQFLEAANALVTTSVLTGGQLRLDYYDLSSGHRTACLTLDIQQVPTALAYAADGYVYILIYDSHYGCDTLYRWNVAQTQIHDPYVYTGHYFTAEEPDLAGLARCQKKADEIGQQYGIRVLLWEEAAAAAPWDYTFEEEYLVPVIEQALTRLEQHLVQFPRAMLAATAKNFEGLSICLVRQITARAETGLSDTVSGLQYFLGSEACIALAAGQDTDKAFYHELYHVMETHILNNSIALDQWDALNPKGFTYDLDYLANLSRDGSEYLRQETRAFIDTYSMSYPREDRARIMEYACTPGNESCFQSEPMQRKLRTLCQGIREAYGLNKSTETYLWEQYLFVPMT